MSSTVLILLSRLPPRFQLVHPVYPEAKFSDSFLSFYCFFYFFSISQILKSIPTLLSMPNANWVPKNATTFPSTGVSLIMDAASSASCSRPPATHTDPSADSTIYCLQAVMLWFDSHGRYLCQGNQISAIICGFLSHPASHLSVFLLQEPIIMSLGCNVTFSIQERAALWPYAQLTKGNRERNSP